MKTAQVVETSVTVNNNSPVHDYVHPDDQTQPTFEMTPGFKPLTVYIFVVVICCCFPSQYASNNRGHVPNQNLHKSKVSTNSGSQTIT